MAKSTAENAYAIILAGGKQHRIKVGQRCKLELMEGEPGSTITFDKVLMTCDGDKIAIGAPLLAGAKVEAKILDHGRHKKVKIVKLRRRKNSRRQQGHRQHYTQVQITNIQ